MKDGGGCDGALHFYHYFDAACYRGLSALKRLRGICVEEEEEEEVYRFTLRDELNECC